MNRTVMPTGLAPPAANYAHAVLSDSPGRMLHTSGIVPVDPDGVTPLELHAQATVVWRNIGVLLDEVGMGPGDVVSVTTYVVVGEELSAVMSARDRFLVGHLAASTLVTVPALARPEWRMEVAVVAVAARN